MLYPRNLEPRNTRAKKIRPIVFSNSKETESLLDATLFSSTRVKGCYSNQPNISMHSVEAPCIIKPSAASSVTIMFLQTDSQISYLLYFSYPILENPWLYPLLVTRYRLQVVVASLPSPSSLSVWDWGSGRPQPLCRALNIEIFSFEYNGNVRGMIGHSTSEGSLVQKVFRVLYTREKQRKYFSENSWIEDQAFECGKRTNGWTAISLS